METLLQLPVPIWMTNKLRFAGLAALALVTWAGNAPANAEMPEFDQAITAFMSKWQVPGASIAVASGGKVVFAKGYGLADRDRAIPVTAQTLFRTGSINKVVTAVAVLKLVESNRLGLDDTVLPVLERVGIVPARLGDERSRSITVRHLLEHSAGFDRAISGDPFFHPRLREVASRQRTAPVTCEAIARDSLQSRLDFTPGERFAYSNVGYCMLGKIVEAVAEQPFAAFVSKEVLTPSIGKPLRIGKSTESVAGEAIYYPYPGEPKALPAPGFAGMFGVPAPYGAYAIESMEALGAWIGTPTEVLRFMLSIDGARSPRLLAESTVRAMRAPPPYALAKGAVPRRYYGLGVWVLRDGAVENWWHTGSQPGLKTLALRTSRGWGWVVAFNTKPRREDADAFFLDFDRALWRAARATAAWPQAEVTLD